MGVKGCGGNGIICHCAYRCSKTTILKQAIVLILDVLFTSRINYRAYLQTGRKSLTFIFVVVVISKGTHCDAYYDTVRYFIHASLLFTSTLIKLNLCNFNLLQPLL